MLAKQTISPLDALAAIVSLTGRGIYASSDQHFKGAIFGRDSLEVAEDMLSFKPDLVRTILLTLAAFQGEAIVPIRDEEPGKILHELRTNNIDGIPLSGDSKRIFAELSHKWGGSEDYMIYYGSVDATPLFVRVLSKYCELYGREILDEIVLLPSGTAQTIHDSMTHAIDWIIATLNNHPLFLLAYQRHNPKGIKNQVWKDSEEFYIHSDGSPANHKRPIASIEVQGITYDALCAAAELLPKRSLELLEAAQKLQRSTFDSFWMPQENYFALAIDFDKQNEPCQLRTITANPISLLDSTIFDSVPKEQKQKYIKSLVLRAFSKDFLTDAGIRSRGLCEVDLVQYWDYHGSCTSWPKETYDIIKGLYYQGFPLLAEQLENRLMNVMAATNSYPEFFHVAPNGTIYFSPQADGVLSIDAATKPEIMQAWTVSAILGVLHGNTNYHTANHKNWQRELEQKILSSSNSMSLIHDAKELHRLYPQQSFYYAPQKPGTGFWSFLESS